jgi:glyoxylase-like metal-dependent hydrolase (beta-lactamase superfamily II)
VGRNGIEVYQSSQGARVFRIPLELFPSLNGFAHLVIADEITALIDVGSGVGDSNHQLEDGLLQIKEEFKEASGWKDLTHVLISHGHIDHFGGLPYVQSKTDALVGVHELDRRVITGYEERLTVVAHRLQEFLIEAGVEAQVQDALMSMYLLNKHLFRSTSINFVLNGANSSIGPLKIIHVPGHCPGQVVIQVDDILLTSDHILKTTSPHQAPEQLTLNTGLGHYLDSLGKIVPLSSEIKIALGGHEPAITDLGERIQETINLHKERLIQVLELVEEPRTIIEISNMLFPQTDGYHKLLAIEEAGAHVEYLAQRGYLSIENLGELEIGVPVPIVYRRRDGTLPPQL